MDSDPDQIFFEQGCPYHRPLLDEPEMSGTELPMFRLFETFVDFSVSSGDSFGNKFYIDRFAKRSCSPFSFEVVKTPTAMTVRVRSDDLCSHLASLLNLKCTPAEGGSYRCLILNGLELLKAFDLLQYDPHRFRAVHVEKLKPGRLKRELDLFVEGFLADYRIFERFDFGYLYVNGCLTQSLWDKDHGSKYPKHSVDSLQYQDTPSIRLYPGSIRPTERLTILPFWWCKLNPRWIQYESACTLPKIPPITWTVQHAQDLSKELKLSNLRRKLRKQHDSISTSAAKRPLQKFPSWADGFRYNYIQAWGRGNRVMRGLCKGETPTSLHDTLMFFALSRAIIYSNLAADVPEAHVEFLADLGRWQILFESDPSAWSAFRMAVSDIWGVEATDFNFENTPDSKCLLLFQELALRLASGVDSLFGNQEGHHDRPLPDFDRWQGDSASNVADIWSRRPLRQNFTGKSVDRGGGAGSNAPHTTASWRTKELQIPDLRHPHQASVNSDSTVSHLDVVLMLLVAGFIFGIILAFFLTLQHGVSDASMEQPVYRGSLEDSVMHLYSITKPYIPPKFHYILETFKRTMSYAIQSDIVEDHAGLMNFIETQNPANLLSIDNFEATRLQKQLLFMCTVWQSSYTLQERYQVLQNYLGKTEYKRIVPYKLGPERFAPIASIRQNLASSGSSKPSTCRPLSSSLSDLDSAKTNGMAIPTPSPRFGSLSRFPDIMEVEDQPQPRNYCEECHKQFKSVFSYNEHRRGPAHGGSRPPCPLCRKEVSKKEYRDRHVKLGKCRRRFATRS